MNERDALLTTAVRAVETVDGDRQSWTDEDRSWSSQAAAEAVGEGARAADFIACRARFALDRLRPRDPGFVRVVDGLLWRGWIAALVMVLSFAAGVLIDRIGSGQNINLLAPPVLGLLAWNVAVYLLLLVNSLRRGGKPARQAGPVRRALVAGLAGSGRRLRQRGVAMPAAVLPRLLGDWSQIAAPLYAARVARLLHFAAALFAAGILSGLYLRGLAFEYRAGWESTFLDAETVHRLLSILLAPALWLTGSLLPDVDRLAAIRFGVLPATENAAPWLHLLAATLFIVVIVPRSVLGIASGLLERHRRTRLLGDLGDPYFQRLLHGYLAGPAQLTVIPYSYHPAPATTTGLQRLLRRVFGDNAQLAWATPVSYGEEETLPAGGHREGHGPSVALFSLLATPERETQGAFVRAVRAMGNGGPVLVLVDEAPWRARFDPDPRRIEQRRAAWRSELADLAELGLTPVFLDLAQADLNAAQDEIERRLEGSA
ncbi:MAG: DUF2868 domain-containing protein [Candidatus Accumulibacter sp.]|uniref:DUF2868 domain-containing protein n=1 Tax=Accumulibacter sp. TaxID=2053492 RepID=UPI001A38B098|nr:DUF2868 domain-containing protein [Accumulibacter sp.]MBL8369359.1 DUF2868 domain-containing protein [Accumulibacter sp.]MBN8515137.1 DUF2868 domain-containing protein [Accumulibacter sp.]MBO3703670.1 DUF2868 domain-containing protein [Accumulibacter sp.]